MRIDRRLLIGGTIATVAVAGASYVLARHFAAPLSPKASSVGDSAVGSANHAPAETQLALVPRHGPPANELGLVPVLEYHSVGPAESRWVRSVVHFRQDLAWLYTNGYVTATVQDFLDGFPQVPAGKKPAVITFDDARGDQFKAASVDSSGLAIPTPDCAVGIMMDFARSHPGFGHRASFYLLPSFFEEEKTVGPKLKFLATKGFELGNHTWTHLQMGKASPEKIRSELLRLQSAVQKYLGPEFKTHTVALPDGSRPKTPKQIAAAVGGVGQPYHHTALLLVGSNPASSLFDRAFNPLKIPRIQAIDDQWRQWFGREPGQNGIDNERFHPYVSDGDPSVVTFPAKFQKRLNQAALKGRKARPLESGLPQPLIAMTATQAASPAIAASVSLVRKAPSASLATSSTSTASVAAGLTVHPGYHLALPPGGIYREGRVFHTVRPGQSFESLSIKYLPFCEAYTSRELRSQITAVNHLKHPWVNVGQTLEIPRVRPQPPRPHPDGVPATFVAKGIYCTSTTASFERIFELGKQLKAVGGNTVVFDAKDGVVSFLPKDLKARAMSKWDHSITDMPKLVDRLHQAGLHVVARHVLFNDPILARLRPDLAIHSKKHPGKIWLQHGRTPWVDPSRREVQDFNLEIAKEIAASGVDEIQFDYVRFPAEGDIGDCKYTFDEKVTPKHAVITAFLKRARQELRPYHCLVGIDVFGVIAWGKEIDERHTGQRIQDMAKYVDVICPMVYPSHFYGSFDGFTHCGDQPYYFVSQGVERVRRKIAPARTSIRPWLQAFGYKVSAYNPGYVAKQLQASRDAHGTGWLLWNAGNKYEVAYAGVGVWTRSANRIPIQAVHIKGEAAKATPGAGRNKTAAAVGQAATKHFHASP